MTQTADTKGVLDLDRDAAVQLFYLWLRPRPSALPVSARMSGPSGVLAAPTARSDWWHGSSEFLLSPSVVKFLLRRKRDALACVHKLETGKWTVQSTACRRAAQTPRVLHWGYQSKHF
jgi:hypothetical protein